MINQINQIEERNKWYIKGVLTGASLLLANQIVGLLIWLWIIQPPLQ